MFIILKRRGDTTSHRATQEITHMVQEAEGVRGIYGVGVFIVVSIGKPRPSKQFWDWLVRITPAASGI